MKVLRRHHPFTPIIGFIFMMLAAATAVLTPFSQWYWVWLVVGAPWVYCAKIRRYSSIGRDMTSVDENDHGGEMRQRDRLDRP